MILPANPRAGYLAYKEEIEAAIARVLENGRYVLGPEVQAFEAEFAKYVGCAFGVGVGSGTDALFLALRACGIGPGDEVITVSHTAVATVAAIEMCGATPVLVDIEPDYFTLAPEGLQAAITPRTKAVIPVHIYGQAAHMPAICRVAHTAGIRVIEDCAQAHGATFDGQQVGTFGDLACFSFYPTKNLGAIGDGGIVLTSDSTLSENLHLLRQYGWRDRYVSHVAGVNSRLDELQAAILRVKLQHLTADNQKRKLLADTYDHGLARLPVVTPARRKNAEHVFHLYVIRTSQRDELRSFLADRHIGTLIHYPVPVHLQPAYQERAGTLGLYPVTERAALEIVSLPLYPELESESVGKICAAMQDFAWQG